ncbi:MAG TPA: hypothetical protein VFQ53_19045 [Kofleriaceae bacterium]|nr:hypothetical protein [Kofleriaceae bacterium]
MGLPDGIAPALARAARTGLASLVLSALVIAGVTLVLAIVAYFVATGGWRGGVAVLCALAAGGVAIGVGAVKRAIGTGLASVLDSAQLGSRLVDQVFDRLGTDATPLALPDATRRLHGAVSQVASSELANSWLARRIGGSVLAIVQSVTSSRFVEESAKHGHVELATVRADLGPRVDQLIQDRVTQAIQRATILAAAIAIAGALVPAVVLRFV